MIDLTNMVTGALMQKAKLVVHDLRKVAKEAEQEAIKKAQAQTTTPGGSPALDRNAIAAQVATPSMDMPTSMQTVMALNGSMVPPAYESEERLVFNVQFNPSELTLSVGLRSNEEIDQTTKKAKSITTEDPQMTMAVTLVFDDMDAYDAFVAERYGLSLSVKTVTNVVNMVKPGKPHSVQPQVDALLSALRNPYTRNVSFEWGDFVFIGQLTYIKANYTMFSVGGHPIRAEVSMRIQHEMDPEMLKNWYENYNRVFRGSNSSLAGKLQGLGNLLNVKL